jgi:5'-nucleotidase
LKTLIGASCAAALIAGCSAPSVVPDAAVEINLVALNDFHGQLEAHSKLVTVDGKETRITVGGIDNMAGAIALWRREDPQLMVVGAGDLIGASPVLSGMYADEPTVFALNQIGLRVSSTGNHEYDGGPDELLRKQQGGCVTSVTDKACVWQPTFGGAKYTYLAANVTNKKSGATVMPAYRIETIKGLRIAFVGAVVRDTEHMILPTRIANIQFNDEVEALNRAIGEVKTQNVDAVITLIHQGAVAKNLTHIDCPDLNGPIVKIVQQLDPVVRLVISGHSHNGYVCQIEGRTVTQAEAYGHLLTRIKLRIVPGTHTVSSITAENIEIAPGKFTPTPEIAKLLADLKARSKEVMSRPVARVGAQNIPKELDKDGSSRLGDIATDAQLAATRAFGAQIAFINDKSIRTFLESTDGVATYSQVAATHPYGNTLNLVTLTGAQVREALEQQNWLATDRTVKERLMLQVSGGLTYRWDASRPLGQRVIRESLIFNGAPLDDKADYRVCINNYLLQGGDNFTIFKQGRDLVDTGIIDLDAMIAYLIAQDKAGTPAGSDKSAGRVVRIN